jgi:hypothetical protein
MKTLAAAASALAVASPAAAQYYPAPPYAQAPVYVPVPQNNGYNGYNGYSGYNNRSYGVARALQVRIDQIQRRISNLAQRRAISRNEQRDLRAESRNLENRLRNHARWGLDGRERYDVEMRIARLEQHVRQEVRDGRRPWRGYNNANNNGWNNANNGGWSDRDRDGRNDRFEDDRGTRHD